MFCVLFCSMSAAALDPTFLGLLSFRFCHTSFCMSHGEFHNSFASAFPNNTILPDLDLCIDPRNLPQE